MQCVHSSSYVTIPWLHLHTFCQSGTVDGMPLSPPQNNMVAYCSRMGSVEEASALAQRIVHWSESVEANANTPF